MSTDLTRYETHTWNPTGDDAECIVCGTTWGECEDACPGIDAPRQAEDELPPLVGLGEPGWTSAGRPEGVKSLPLTFWWGHCPTCRCTRIRHAAGFAEASLLGWTVGVAWT